MKTHDEKTRRQGTIENDIAMEGGKEADFARTKLSKPACDYQISQVTEVPASSGISTGLNLINLQIKEFKQGKTKLLFDTGAVVTLLKELRNLRRETLICEDVNWSYRTRNNCYRKNNCYHTIR